MLLLKNGGADLSQIEDKFKKLTVNTVNRRKLENFWLDMSRILYGSKVLMDNGVVHHDLKLDNILIGANNNLPIIFAATYEPTGSAAFGKIMFNSFILFSKDIVIFS